MPLKTCPKCKKTSGPRLKVCECSHVFGGKPQRRKRARGAAPGSGHPLVPEPGGWVLDSYHGLPEVPCPSFLPSGEVDTDSIRDHVRYEGLGFCIYHLIPPARVQDPTLRKLWAEAKEAMKHITRYLYD